MIPFTIFFKNLRILFRSWGSALIVLIAPLLLVLIIGVSLSSPSSAGLKIGYSGNVTGELNQRIIESLNSTENELVYFASIPSCKRAIELGVVSACIDMSPNLSLDPNSENFLDFYVDESRMNLVYQIISSLTANIHSESAEITKEIGTKLLSILQTSQRLVDESIAQLESLKQQLKENKATASRISRQLDSLNIPDMNLDISHLNSDVKTLEDYLYSVRKASKEVVDTADDVLPGQNNSELDDLEEEINNLEEEWRNTISYFTYATSLHKGINSAQGKIDSVERQIEGLKEDKEELHNLIRDLEAGLKKEETMISSIDEKQSSISGEVESFKVTNPELIATPVKMNITSVNADRRKLVYTFPYLLMLVALFVGMMLPSTLLLMERKSKAFFRNFVTPVRLSFFTFMTYITSIVLISLQLLAIFLVAYFYLDLSVITNLVPTLLVLFLTITVFSLLGIFLGNIFNTFEGITMISITLGSVFLFLSNLVLSLENLSPLVQRIAHFNPYVIGSEALRRSLLFGDSVSSIFPSLAPLFFYIGGLIVLVILSLILIKSRYFYLARG